MSATPGIIDNWNTLGVTGRVDVDSLTVGGLPVTGDSSGASITPDSVVTDSVTTDTLVVGSNPPAAADSTGVAGTVTWDATHIYVCVAEDTWVRADLATWV